MASAKARRTKSPTGILPKDTSISDASGTTLASTRGTHIYILILNYYLRQDEETEKYSYVNVIGSLVNEPKRDE